MRRAKEREGIKRGSRGFTLLEMMMVLGLIIVFSTATAVYNKNIGRQISIAREHAKLLSIFIKARSAGFTIPKVDPLVEVVCGYGVHVDTASHTLTFFKDLGTVGSLCTVVPSNHVYDAPGERIEQVVLDSSLVMTSDLDDIIFTPPFGIVLIDNLDTKHLATVTITSVSASSTKQVTINSYGQISE